MDPRRSSPERRSTSRSASRALHTALRQAGDAPLSSSTAATSFPTSARRNRECGRSSAQIRGGLRVGATGRPIRAVVNLGIGGSDLGAFLVCSALAQPPRTRGSTGPQTQGVDVSFVANVDPEHLTRALAPLDPATTLFVITSKSFTTQETLANAASAKSLAAGGAGQGRRRELAFHRGHRQRAGREGVRRGVRGHPPDMGLGRRTLLPLVACRAADRAQDRLGALSRSSLAGAASVDAHFRETPLERNLPVLLGLMGWWNAAHLRHVERVVVPYAQALVPPARLSAATGAGKPRQARCARRQPSLTEPVRPRCGAKSGPTAQHAFFQWLHQGPREAPVEFIVPVGATHPLARPADAARRRARSGPGAGVDWSGRRADDIRAELAALGAEGWSSMRRSPRRVCPGNRASTMLLMPELCAYRLGQLLALYEHRTFVEAMLYGINPFDEFGVEYGKTLAGPIVAALVRWRSPCRPTPMVPRAGSSRICARGSARAGSSATPGFVTLARR